MDESLQELENELKALRPRRPSVLLRAQLEKELSSAPSPAMSDAAPRRYATASTFRSWKWAGWQLAAAAAVALVVSLGVWRWQSAPGVERAPTAPALAQNSNPASEDALASRPDLPTAIDPTDRRLAAATPTNTYRPVKAANVLYDLQDEGLVLLEDNTPARRVRARYVDTYTWKNPATNASLKWSVPRDEVRVLPASFH